MDRVPIYQAANRAAGLLPDEPDSEFGGRNSKTIIAGKHGKSSTDDPPDRPRAQGAYGPRPHQPHPRRGPTTTRRR